MNRKNLLSGFIFILSLQLFGVPSGPENSLGSSVDEGEAIAVADLWYAMELNSGYTKLYETERADRLNKLIKRQVLYLVSKDDLLNSHPDKEEVLAYVIKYDPTGFVVVSGEDRIEPIVVFSVESEFRWDQPELNFLRYYLGKSMVSRWESLKKELTKGSNVSVHPNSSYLRSKLQKNVGLKEVTHEVSPTSIDVVWDTALWDQWPYYNDTVIANNGGIVGIPTGCTATAMAIKMRFHSWPPSGNGSLKYWDWLGPVSFNHFVNFGAQSYNWSAMPTTPLSSANADVANLMYHCGVAVRMNYEVGSSGAWPSASSMNTYFRYKGTIDLGSSHENPIRDSIRGGLPVVLCTSKHTVVAVGYRDTISPYFYLNCGWSGNNNAWYNLDQIPGGDPTIDWSYPYSSPDNYIYVDAIWNGTENGNINNPYNTLSEGESSVPAGGDLWIKAGTYTGSGNVPITFDKAMTIRSYEGTAVIGGRISLSTSGRVQIYSNGELRIY